MPALHGEEVKAINEAIMFDKNKYFPDETLRARKETLRSLEESLREDVGGDLALKAMAAPFVDSLGVRALYDGISQHLAASPNVSIIEVCDAERGPILLLSTRNKKFIFKHFQGRYEWETASLASQAGTGPKVYGPGFELIEDYAGKMGLPLRSPRTLGTMAGKLLRRLHDRDIIYGDTFYRHLRYNHGTLVLIDYGISIPHSKLSQIEDLWVLNHLKKIDEGDGWPNSYFDLTESQRDELRKMKAEDLKRIEKDKMRREISERLPLYGFIERNLPMVSCFTERFTEGFETGYDHQLNPN